MSVGQKPKCGLLSKIVMALKLKNHPGLPASCKVAGIMRKATARIFKNVADDFGKA